MDGKTALETYELIKTTNAYQAIASAPEIATHVLLSGILQELLEWKHNVQASTK